MKKFIGFVLSLILGFAVINAYYVWTLSRIDWDFSKTKEARNFNNQAFKILVFGNSTALDGINTAEISQSIGSSYNFSVGGASLETNYVQFKEYLKQNQKPDKVLLFLSSCHVNYNKVYEVNPIVDYYYLNSPLSGLAQLPLFKFRWLFIENIKKIISSDHRSATVVAGQLRINKSIPDTSVERIGNCPGQVDYSNNGYRYMIEFAKTCHAQNIDLFVFEMPGWKRFQNSCPDDSFAISEYRVPIFNLNSYEICNSLLNPKTDWLSENHLNYTGSVKLTNKVIEILGKVD